MAEKKDKKLYIEIVRQMLTLATAGFGLVAALAWNNAVQHYVNTTIKRWFPEGTGLSLLLYAVVVTALAVFVTFQLSKLLRRLEGEKNS